jgi:hypothetical protein
MGQRAYCFPRLSGGGLDLIRALRWPPDRHSTKVLIGELPRRPTATLDLCQLSARQTEFHKNAETTTSPCPQVLLPVSEIAGGRGPFRSLSSASDIERVMA